MRFQYFLLALGLSAIATAQKTLNVFAAASLREPLQAIARKYELDHPGLKVALTFAGSQQLAAQINAGAPCDVFAAASITTMQSVKLMEREHWFATNRLTLIAPKGGKELTLKGLANVKSIVLAAAPVPAGQYARSVLNAAAKDLGQGWLRLVIGHVVSQEQDVRAVLAKVQLGEADAGIVYVTDAISADGKVQSFAIPDRYEPGIVYPVGIPSAAASRDESRHFIHAITDPGGQALLARAGFGSVMLPAKGFTLEHGSKSVQVGLSKFQGQSQVSFEAIGPRGAHMKFKGWPMTPLLANVEAKEADLNAADNYTVTVAFKDLKKGYIVKMSDGNLQIVIPGLSPQYWVNWLRTISLK